MVIILQVICDFLDYQTSLLLLVCAIVFLMPFISSLRLEDDAAACFLLHISTFFDLHNAMAIDKREIMPAIL